ncbi:NAD-dependent epimerase/dehydratase family protein [Desulfohalovibrio reitneri]|uniref:NAD-dependent epimerase/dehydratase family protein n=1 Tax=Desulfohalovibrio reitneri TaxID=1307759 RepID=UPI0004A73DAB|nr:NAD-dependent epimerase/dehydratase family protein [Desulfohalovibrio reitneri]
MRVLILGGDGYLGWPTAMALAAKGHDVLAADNYLRRTICLETDSEPLLPVPTLAERAELFQEASGSQVRVAVGDCADMRFMEWLVEEHRPEAVIHYAEQPSAPYSMMGFEQAKLTLDNNLGTTFNLVWAVLRHAPDCHIVKLGTMGEYGTPDIDIEEGWLEIEHKGRRDTFLYPRQAASLYHTTKIQDTDLLWFYVRTHGLRVTDLMQGPVYGLSTDEADLHPRLAPYFNYDDIFGTVVNRFLVQAAAGVPLTVYGKGGQERGYLNIKDTLQCVELAMNSPADKGELRIFNQFTEQFTVLDLAERIQAAGRLHSLDVAVKSIPNPRKEAEEHYYNAAHSGLLDLGLKPHYMTEDVLGEMLERVLRNRDRIDNRKILPRVKWS